MDSSVINEPYIEVWHGRVVIAKATRTPSEYTLKRATNWQELESEARSLLRTMETPVSGTVFPCPPQLAQRAAFSDEAGEDWISLAQASRLSGLTKEELNQAIARGFLDVKILLDAEGKASRKVRRTQMGSVWSLELYKDLHWISSEFQIPDSQYLISRFWKKAAVGPREVCWPWLAGKTSKGGRIYGAYWERGKTQRAHRVAYRMLFGEIPADKHLRHTCGNTLCVNPLHLLLGDGPRTTALGSTGFLITL